MRSFNTFLLLAAMLLGLPLLGVVLVGRPLSLYLEFPPQTRHIVHAPFSWGVFAVYCAVILFMTTPFLVRGGTGPRKTHLAVRPFPWWGWAGILWTLCAWMVAWNRFSWTGSLQAHTFTPLWLGYIITINALTCRRTGSCMLTHRPVYFLLLFPVSAIFWWFFEYLNRFVGNWYYVGTELGAWEYFWYATLPFSTVLPAVLGTRDWLLSFSWPGSRFGDFYRIKVARPRALAWIVLLVSAAGLAGIGIWPNTLFPLLWVSPLLILLSLQTLLGENHILSTVTTGNWQLVVCSALGALICGFFWEMWNYYSLAKWKYSIPFVHAFPVFEMPLLGYAGYLPFGLECALIGSLVENWFTPAE